MNLFSEGIQGFWFKEQTFHGMKAKVILFSGFGVQQRLKQEALKVSTLCFLKMYPEVHPSPPIQAGVCSQEPNCPQQAESEWN